jgi:hypothetical protein
MREKLENILIVSGLSLIILVSIIWMIELINTNPVIM